MTVSFVGRNVTFSRFRQFHSNCWQNIGFGSEAHSLVSQLLQLFVVKKFQRWLNGTGCESLHVVITVCPSIWASPCQCDTSKITASCANSRLPTSHTCHPCYDKSTQIHMHAHARLRRESNSRCASRTHVHDFLRIYMYSLSIILIDSTRGRDAALYTPVLVMISLQNINGCCRRHLK